MQLARAHDQHDELLHPLWLGSLMLFAVITILSVVCFIRKKCGAQLRHALRAVCCGTDYKPKERPKVAKQSSISGPYNWAPVYNPAPNLSPKLYSLVRNLKMSSFERESSIQPSSSYDDGGERDVPTPVSELDQTKLMVVVPKPSEGQPTLAGNRNCETARRFYASMRQTSQCQASSSIDSSNNGSFAASQERNSRSHSGENFKFIAAPRFFQSVSSSIL